MKFPDRVKQVVTGSTAALTLGAAVLPYRTLADAITAGDVAIGDRLSVTIEDAAGNAEWSYYTVTSSTQLTRESVYRTSGTVTFPATAFCTAFGKDLVVTRDIAFTTTVPLTHPGSAYMAAHTVTGPLAFTVATGAVRGALAYLRLTADGTNTPTFSGFNEWGGSLGYDNRAGIVNQLQFFCDGVDSWYSISQAVGATAAAAPTAPATMSAPVATAGVLSASIAFSAPSNGGAAITGYTVTASTGQTATGTTSPIVITMPANVAATFTITATNSVGTSVPSPASNSVTPTAAATVPGAPTIGTAVAGDGYVDVAFTAPASNGGATITGYTATLSTGETATGTTSPIRVTAANGPARTANVKATNSVGTGPASAESNSVTPQAADPAAEDGRMTSLDRVAEVGTSAPYSYYPTATTAYGSDSADGLFTKALKAGEDGYLQVTITTATNDLQPMLGLKSTNVTGALSTQTYGLFLKSGTTYEAYTNGAHSPQGLPAIARQANDKVRLRREGTNLHAEIQRAAGGAWLVYHTWTGVPTGVLYFNMHMVGNANSTTRITNIKYGNLA